MHKAPLFVDSKTSSGVDKDNRESHGTLNNEKLSWPECMPKYVGLEESLDNWYKNSENKFGYSCLSAIVMNIIITQTYLPICKQHTINLLKEVLNISTSLWGAMIKQAYITKTVTHKIKHEMKFHTDPSEHTNMVTDTIMHNLQHAVSSYQQGNMVMEIYNVKHLIMECPAFTNLMKDSMFDLSVQIAPIWVLTEEEYIILKHNLFLFSVSDYGISELLSEHDTRYVRKIKSIWVSTLKSSDNISEMFVIYQYFSTNNLLSPLVQLITEEEVCEIYKCAFDYTGNYLRQYFLRVFDSDQEIEHYRDLIEKIRCAFENDPNNRRLKCLLWSCHLCHHIQTSFFPLKLNSSEEVNNVVPWLYIRKIPTNMDILTASKQQKSLQEKVPVPLVCFDKNKTTFSLEDGSQKCQEMKIYTTMRIENIMDMLYATPSSKNLAHENDKLEREAMCMALSLQKDNVGAVWNLRASTKKSVIVYNKQAAKCVLLTMVLPVNNVDNPRIFVYYPSSNEEVAGEDRPVVFWMTKIECTQWLRQTIQLWGCGQCMCMPLVLLNASHEFENYDGFKIMSSCCHKRVLEDVSHIISDYEK